MGQPVNVGELAGEPAGEQVDGQREAVHLREQGHQEGRKGTEGAPVALRLRLGEAEGEDDEDGRVDDDQRPQAVGRGFAHLRSPSDSSDLKERQSRFVCGLAKLKAKMMKMAELMMTSDHKP